MQTLTFTPVPRPCEVCGASDFGELWRLRKRVRTRTRQYLFDHGVGACRVCGFVYVSPGYLDDELAAYYADSFANWLGVPNYTWERRLEFISRHAQRGTFLEIGGNNDDAMVEVLNKAGFTVMRYDQNVDAPRDIADLGELADGSIDVIAHYYTLEHVAKAEDFLRTCRRLLQSNGVMICEVPDLDRYSVDPAEQLGAVEHQRHFTAATLVALAQRAGLEPLEISYTLVSKPCGFAAAFRPEKNVQPMSPAFVSASTRVLEGAALIAENEAALTRLADAISTVATKERPVVIWGANPITADLVDRLHAQADAVVALDDDPLKADYFENVPMLPPAKAVDVLKRARALISSRRHLAETFRLRSESLGGRSFPPALVAVLDHGVCEFDEAAFGEV